MVNPEINTPAPADPRGPMKAVLANDNGRAPCVVYWTGRVRLHVGVVTWCAKERDGGSGVLQVPTDTPCCTECESAIRDRRYPKL